MSDTWSKYTVDNLKEPVTLSSFQNEDNGRTYIQFGTIDRPSVHGALVFDCEADLGYCPDTNIWFGSYINSDGWFDFGYVEAAEFADKLGLKSAVNEFCAEHNMNQPDFDRKPDFIAVKGNHSFVLVGSDDYSWKTKGTGEFVKVGGNSYELLEGADEWNRERIDNFIYDKAPEEFDVSKYITEAPKRDAQDKPMSFRDSVFAKGAEALNEKSAGIGEIGKEEAQRA